MAGANHEKLSDEMLRLWVGSRNAIQDVRGDEAETGWPLCDCRTAVADPGVVPSETTKEGTMTAMWDEIKQVVRDYFAPVTWAWKKLRRK